MAEYHEIMKQQLKEGILEPVPEIPMGEVVHYIPHPAVIRDEAETTRLRSIYDCSAKENMHLPSLNDCLEIGPSLQPLIFDIMLRNHMKKYCITRVSFRSRWIHWIEMPKDCSGMIIWRKSELWHIVSQE